jgi:hypothetical protein
MQRGATCRALFFAAADADPAGRSGHFVFTAMRCEPLEYKRYFSPIHHAGNSTSQGVDESRTASARHLFAAQPADDGALFSPVSTPSSRR